MFAAMSCTRRRSRRLTRPTTQPSTIAIPSERTKSQATPAADSSADCTTATAAADRSSASAVASLSSDSPWSTEVSRCETPTSLTIEVATASVGLTIAPSAIAAGSGSVGTRAWKTSPSPTALTTTSTIARPEIVRRSRRKSIAGIETAAEYRSGGSTPARMISGSTVTSGIVGSREIPMPSTTRMRGEAIRRRGASDAESAMTTRARTPIARDTIAQGCHRSRSTCATLEA